MPLILWLAFLAFPALEIVLLVKIGGAIGAWPTVGLVLLGFLAGGLLLHRQGLSTLARVRAEFAEGKLPVETLLNGLILSIAALALLFPGVVSDALALLLILPPLRGWAIRRVADVARRHFIPPSAPGRADEASVIEGEYRDISGAAEEPKPPSSSRIGRR